MGFINWLMRSIVFLVCYGYLSVRTFNCFSWNSVLCIGKQQHQDSNIQMRSMICISVLTWSYSSGLWMNDMAINTFSSYWLNWNQNGLLKYISENCVVSSISMYAAIIYKFRMEPSKKNLYPRFISNKMLVRGGSVIAIFICGTNIHEYKTFNNHRTQNQQV